MLKKNSEIVAVMVLLFFYSYVYPSFYNSDENTISYWSFNSSTFTVSDLSGNALHGTVFNSSFTDSSMLFSSGSGTYAVFPSIDSLLATDSFTIQTRIKITQLPSASESEAVIFGYRDGSGTTEYGYELGIKLIDGKGFLFCMLGGKDSPCILVSSTPLEINSWYDIALQYDKKHLTIFVNGYMNAQQFYSDSLRLIDSSFYVGCRPAETRSAFFDGEIKEVVVSKTTRLPYHNFVLPKDKYTVGLWRFNSLEGGLALDESDNENHGVVSGNVTCVTENGKTFYKFRNSLTKMDISNISELETSNNFSIEAILRTPSFSTDTGRILFRIMNDDSLSIGVDICRDYKRNFAFFTYGPYAIPELSKAIIKAPIPIGLEHSWYKLKVEYRLGRRKIFLNDSCIASDTVNIMIKFPKHYFTCIGNDNGERHNTFLHSDIDEFKISNFNHNYKPVFISIPDTVAIESHLYTYPISVIDPDSDVVTLKLEKGSKNMFIRNDTLFFQPDSIDVSVCSLLISATDDKGGVSFQSSVIKVLSREAHIVISRIHPAQDSLCIAEGEAISFMVSANSKDEWRAISYQWYDEGVLIATDSAIVINTSYASPRVKEIKLILFDGVEFFERKWHICINNIEIKPQIVKPIEGGFVSYDSLFIWLLSDPDYSLDSTKFDITFSKAINPDSSIFSIRAVQGFELKLSQVDTHGEFQDQTPYLWRVRIHDSIDTAAYSKPELFVFTNNESVIESNQEFHDDANCFNIYPNPSNPATRIHISHQKKGILCISIYNIKGDIIKKYYLPKLNNSVSVNWDGKDANNIACASGIYIVDAVIDGFRQRKRILLSR